MYKHRSIAGYHIVRVGYPRPSRSVAYLAMLLTCSFLFGAACWMAGGGVVDGNGDGNLGRRWRTPAPGSEIEGYPR